MEAALDYSNRKRMNEEKISYRKQSLFTTPDKEHLAITRKELLSWQE